ncbi:restriction endonuclease subunit S [Lactobacillus mulieris]|uniref:restriction endonuclease subunit S n=1 Tax=Lactobacillus mulieris TaxID=2508708 RepID=UPI0009BAEA7E|nr:restriction endonuclease subunit S [Lactobacillus jensenii]
MYPKVRFRGFDEPWKKVKLGDVAEIIGGGTPSTSNLEYWDGNINWFTPTEVGKTIYLHESQRKLSELGLKKSSARLLNPGAILFTSRAGIGNTGIIINPSATNQGFQSIQPNKNIIDSYFIFCLSSRLKRYALKHSAGSTFTEISGSEMKKAKIRICAKNEQNKISTCIKSLDSLLSLQQRKLELEKQLKKFCLQNILSDNKKCPNLRFHDFSTNWKKVKVGDIFTVTRGKVLSKDKISKTKDHIMKYPVYSSQTLNNGLLGYYHDYLFEDAITWTTDGANAGTVRLRAGKFYGTNVNGVLLSKNGYVNDANAEALNQIAWKYVSKVGNPKLMNNVMQNIMFSIAPSVEEQVIISKLFILHSKSLKIYQANINVYTQLKQFLLQNLFI